MRESSVYTFYELQFTRFQEILDNRRMGGSSVILHEDRAFVFLLSENRPNSNEYVLHMWNSTGSISLGANIVIVNDDPNKKMPLAEMGFLMDRYISGKGICSNCGCEIDINDARKNGRNIYAGFYCEECWKDPGIQREKSWEGN